MKLARWKLYLLLVIALGGVLGIYEHYRTWREDSQDKPILAAATRYGLDPALVKAVVWRESSFNPNAKGRKGEIGLMQIMKDTSEDWARVEKIRLFVHTDLYDPIKNTQCGTWYLRKVLLRYLKTDNCTAYALADYNAGRGNVLKWMSGAAATNSAVFIAQIGFPSTKEYVLTTLDRYGHYKAEGFGRTPVKP